MNRFLRKPVFLIPLLVLLGLGLFLSQAQAERVQQKVTRDVIEGQIPQLAHPEFIKPKIRAEIRRICTGKDYCQMEKCSNFYATVNFLSVFFMLQPNNSIHLGPAPTSSACFGGTLDMTCIGFPRDDVFDRDGQPGFLAEQLFSCAYNNDGKAKPFENEACKNPYQSSVWDCFKFVIYYNIADVDSLNTYIFEQEGIANFFDPPTKVPVCIGTGVNLSEWAKACKNVCCFD
ncbi:MAG: hypothetical protein ABH871_07395 [Pseudomonadota bacterium]